MGKHFFCRYICIWLLKNYLLNCSFNCQSNSRLLMYVPRANIYMLIFRVPSISPYLMTKKEKSWVLYINKKAGKKPSKPGWIILVQKCGVLLNLLRPSLENSLPKRTGTGTIQYWSIAGAGVCGVVLSPGCWTCMVSKFLH